MQGPRVRSLVWEDPTCHGETKPVDHNHQAVLHSKRGHCSEKPTYPHEESRPLTATRESPCAAAKTQRRQSKTQKTQALSKVSLLNGSVKFAQSCPTLCDPMDYSVHGILQARILEWVAVPFSRGSSRPRR